MPSSVRIGAVLPVRGSIISLSARTESLVKVVKEGGMSTVLTAYRKKRGIRSAIFMPEIYSNSNTDFQNVYNTKGWVRLLILPNLEISDDFRLHSK